MKCWRILLRTLALFALAAGIAAAQNVSFGSGNDLPNDATQYSAEPALGAAPATGGDRQSPDDAWWTGPLLAPNASTLPRGHFLIEPYLYDVIGAHSNGFGSLTYINYGLVKQIHGRHDPHLWLQQIERWAKQRRNRVGRRHRAGAIRAPAIS